MKLNFKKILLVSILTTLVALVASFLALPDNSGYAGLFFLSISPIFICVFIIWTLILSAAISLKDIFRKLIVVTLTTIIFEYFLIVIVMWTMSDDNTAYNFNSFLSDCASIFSNTAILFYIVTVATVYSILLKYIGNITNK